MRFEGETLDDCMRTMRSQHQQALRYIFRIGAKDSTTRRIRVPMMWMMYTAEQGRLGIFGSRLVYMISGQSAGFDIWQNTQIWRY